MKLALGTAQFGLEYGIANQDGQVSRDEVESIVRQARAAGMDTLDTAIAYGDSEQRLGDVGVAGWHVVSKLPALPAGCGDITKWVERSVDESLARLRINGLYGLLLHRPAQLAGAEGRQLYRALEQIKGAGRAHRIGVSIYDPAELDTLDGFSLDLVQAPFNLLDRRLLRTGWMARLADSGTELHVRSVFLQGLLLMPAARRPRPFDRWAAHWSGYDNWLAESRQSALQASVGYPLSFPEIARVVVGVDSAAHLRGILEAMKRPEPGAPPSFDSEDPELVDPSRWAVTP